MGESILNCPKLLVCPSKFLLCYWNTYFFQRIHHPYLCPPPPIHLFTPSTPPEPCKRTMTRSFEGHAQHRRSSPRKHRRTVFFGVEKERQDIAATSSASLKAHRLETELGLEAIAMALAKKSGGKKSEDPAPPRPAAAPARGTRSRSGIFYDKWLGKLQYLLPFNHSNVTPM